MDFVKIVHINSADSYEKNIEKFLGSFDFSDSGVDLVSIFEEVLCKYGVLPERNFKSEKDDKSHDISMAETAKKGIVKLKAEQKLNMYCEMLHTLHEKWVMHVLPEDYVYICEDEFLLLPVEFLGDDKWEALYQHTALLRTLFHSNTISMKQVKKYFSTRIIEMVDENNAEDVEGLKRIIRIVNTERSFARNPGIQVICMMPFAEYVARQVIDHSLRWEKAFYEYKIHQLEMQKNEISEQLDSLKEELMKNELMLIGDNSIVQHKSLGRGAIRSVDSSYIIVSFSGVEKKLSMKYCGKDGLFFLENDKMEAIKRYELLKSDIKDKISVHKQYTNRIKQLKRAVTKKYYGLNL